MTCATCTQLRKDLDALTERVQKLEYKRSAPRKKFPMSKSAWLIWKLLNKPPIRTWSADVLAEKVWIERCREISRRRISVAAEVSRIRKFLGKKCIITLGVPNKGYMLNPKWKATDEQVAQLAEIEAARDNGEFTI